MAFNGSGTFSRTNGVNSGSTLWQLDRDAGTKILATRHDTHDEDLATALSNVICRDGQSTVTANIPFSGYRLLNVGAGTARTDGARVSQIQDGSAQWGGTSTFSSGVYGITLSPPITAYASGQRFIFIAGGSNTGNATLNVNAVGAVTIKKGGTVTLESGDIVSGRVYDVVYDSTGGGVFHLLNLDYPTNNTGWGPSFSGSGSMTVTGVTTNIARTFRFGPFTYISINANFTIGGTPSTDVQFTPLYNAAGGTDVNMACNITDNGTIVAGTCRSSAGSTFNVRRYDSANWTGGAGTIQVSGMYYSG